MEDQCHVNGPKTLLHEERAEPANSGCESQPQEDDESLSVECPINPPPGRLEEVINEGRRRLGAHCELVDRSHQALYSVLGYLFVQSVWLDHFKYRGDKEKLVVAVFDLITNNEDIPNNLAARSARDLLLMVYFGAGRKDAPTRSKYRTLLKAAEGDKVPLDESAFIAWINANGGYEAIIESYRAAHPSHHVTSNRRKRGEPDSSGSLLMELESKLQLDWPSTETVRVHVSLENEVHDGLTLFLGHPMGEVAEDGTCECKIISKIADPSLVAGAVAVATRNADEAAELERFESEELWKINRFMLRYRGAMPGKADTEEYKRFREAIMTVSKHPVLGPRYFDGPPQFPDAKIDPSEGIDLLLSKTRVDAGQLDPAQFIGNAKVGALVPYEYTNAVEGLKYQKSIQAYLASRPKRSKSVHSMPKPDTSEVNDADVDEEAVDA